MSWPVGYPPMRSLNESLLFQIQKDMENFNIRLQIEIMNK